MKNVLCLITLFACALAHADIQEVTDANFKEKTAQGKVVVKFYKHGCHFCETAQKVYDPLSQNPNYNSITFLKMDAEAPESQKTADALGINGLPTFVFYNNGMKVNTSKSGVTTEEGIKAEFRKAKFIS